MPVNTLRVAPYHRAVTCQSCVPGIAVIFMYYRLLRNREPVKACAGGNSLAYEPDLPVVAIVGGKDQAERGQRTSSLHEQ